MAIKKNDELSPEDEKMQEEIDILKATFLCTKDMCIEFDKYLNSVRSRNSEKIPAIQLRHELDQWAMRCDNADYSKELYKSLAVILKDLADKERVHAEVAFSKSWNPIKNWFQDEYPVFMNDINRLPAMRNEFYAARKKQAAKQTAVNEVALQKAAERYKAHTEIINMKLGQQKDIQKYHQHCINAYMKDIHNYNKAFHRANVASIAKMRELLEKNVPATPEPLLELPAGQDQRRVATKGSDREARTSKSQEQR